MYSLWILDILDQCLGANLVIKILFKIIDWMQLITD